ncbi:MAG: hypothetical protein QXS20_03085 [Candidatus Thorarchaeota archaeon]
MVPENICPVCGASVGKGSTHCIKCGSRLDGTMDVKKREADAATPVSASLEQTSARMNESLENVDTLPWDFELEEGTEDTPSSVDLGVDFPAVSAAYQDRDGTNPVDDGTPQDVEMGHTDSLPEDIVEAAVGDADSESQSPPAEIDWDESGIIESSSEDIKEGNPFVEIEPPKVNHEDDEQPVLDVDEHTIPSVMDEADRQVVEHLFPAGRGTTSRDFIEAIVGKPRKRSDVQVTEATGLNCPTCGTPMVSDGFTYPPYVFEAMARARLEAGLQLLREGQHEKAIESFEKAKRLAEESENPKIIEEATRRVDEGYEAMAATHFAQGEKLAKEGEFEWSIVQFKKAREIYMLTADARARARCNERVREVYSEWGRHIEEEGDSLAKKGFVRDALMRYQMAGEKYKLGDDTKRLRALDKKIRKV